MNRLFFNWPSFILAISKYGGSLFMSKEKLTSSAYSQRLWQMSNALRGNLDGNEFKDYILGLLFYVNKIKKFMKGEKSL